MENRITTFKAYWLFYVGLHQNKMNRNLHFAGIALVLLFLLLGVARTPLFFLAMPICGYGLAWTGHFFFERNWPATFSYPLWSLMADFQMFAFMCLGRMDREVKRMGILRESA
jgi:hypothetical protein